MPIDWRETLGALDQSTAATLARRQMEQAALMNLIKEQDALRTSENTRAYNTEAKKAQALANTARAEEMQQNTLQKLTNNLTPGQNITDNPQLQQKLQTTGNADLMTTTPDTSGNLPSTQTMSAATGLPTGQHSGSEMMGDTETDQGVSLVDGIQQAKLVSGEKPQVIFKGRPDQVQQQLKVKLISDYMDAKTPEAKQRAQTQLALQFGIKQFGTQLWGPDPKTGQMTMLGEVPVGTGMKTVGGGSMNGGVLTEAEIKPLADLVARQGGFQGIPMGRGNAAAKNSTEILKYIADHPDQYNPDLPSTHALYDSAKKNYTTLSRQGAQLEAAAKTATDNLQLVAAAAPTIQYKTASPWVNHWINEFRNGATGAPELSDYEVKVYTAIREYAKVTSGSYNSVAELSAAAAKHAQALLNAAQNPEQAKKAIEAMQADMTNVRKNFASMLQEQRNIFANTGRATANAPAIGPNGQVLEPAGGGGGGAAPAAGMVKKGQIVRKMENGKLRRKPVLQDGPIPAGWEPE